ncbi:N-acyl homoserine lactonase family protein [Methylorubrum sp. SL192]|uniref:N-acyl homoserine lactonase family protein n=1 Tax=Methylorubrum sp. SL192 TaxID=2995167 RepID=UPI0022761D30|nr:N-acyl homoserine lactonase family protein [Methylorubrum sp. SL192]MCY1640532.1 N-acyl homoserine lactonase family protein [Methylorubrum sp. SL192]
MTTQKYEVFALRYATHADRKKSENFISTDLHDNCGMPLDFYMWVIRNDERTIIVDTGFDASSAERRKRTFLENPVDMLKHIDIDPLEIKDVIITHMHYDHSGNLMSFPNARVHVQEAEISYCTGRCMCHDLLRKPFDVNDVVNAIRINYEGRLVFHQDRTNLFPGISVHRVGGHTKGLQIVRVNTERGYIVLASDAAHYWTNIIDKQPVPMVVDLDDMLDAYATINKFADGEYHVIPGHDPNVLEIFPKYKGHKNIVMLHAWPSWS